MSQSLQSSLKNLKAGVAKLDYELTTNTLEKLTSLLKLVVSTPLLVLRRVLIAISFNNNIIITFNACFRNLDTHWMPKWHTTWSPSSTMT